MPPTRRSLLLSSCLLAPRAAGTEALEVKAKRKLSDEWKVFPTPTVSHPRGLQPGKAKIATGGFGGRTDRKLEGARFFRSVQDRGRWWPADPDRRPFLKADICSTTPGGSKNHRAALQRKFGTPEERAAATVALVYALSWKFAAGVGQEKKLTFQQPGLTGFAGDCLPVFHSDFESWCDKYARRLTETKDDPWLLGHYSDNELPVYPDLLDRALQFDTGNPELAPAYNAAEQWLAARGHTEVNDHDREAFVEYIYDRYFQVTTAAIRRYDPNHLCLGPRLHGGAIRHRGVLRADGRHLDAAGCNISARWAPGRHRDRAPSQRSGLGLRQHHRRRLAGGDAAGSRAVLCELPPLHARISKGLVKINCEPYQPLQDGMRE